MPRQYDIVLYGATGRPFQVVVDIGFTGKLATRYVVEHCATDLKWAVAGRSHTKLAALVEETKALNVNRKPVNIIIADSNDLEALSSLARATKVVVSFAGPFARYPPTFLCADKTRKQSRTSMCRKRNSLRGYYRRDALVCPRAFVNPGSADSSHNTMRDRPQRPQSSFLVADWTLYRAI